MTRIFILVLAFTMAGCASDSASHERTVKKNSDTPAAEQSSDETDSSSRVLKKKDCPRGSTLQNGKCTLSVESDD
jgi:PBP1b-binding outer membrane lipoprotein LpoB